jgi:Na+/glutamate symporter
MNICCSGVKIILIDNILRTKLLWRLMTFLTVQLLFDKLSHTFLMLLFFTTYLTRNFLKHTVEPHER